LPYHQEDLHAFTGLVIPTKRSNSVFDRLVGMSLNALDMPYTKARLLSYLGLSFPLDDVEFNAEESSVGFLIGEGFFKGEYIFGSEHDQNLSNKTQPPQYTPFNRLVGITNTTPLVYKSF
jgi:hypothetical protein